MEAELPPSPFLVENAERLRAAARLGSVLDVACGRGRHALEAARLGARAVGIDRSAEALSALRARAGAERLRVAAVRADLETPHGLPTRPGVFGAVLVFRFLARALAGELARALRPGGLLLYETFTVRQLELGRGPKNPAFLLAEGELPRLFPALEIVEYAEVATGGPRPEHLARLIARRISL